MTSSTPRIPRHRPLLACSENRCRSGRDSCPCPEACELPEPETRGDGAGVMLVPAAVALFAIVCGALAAAFFN